MPDLEAIEKSVFFITRIGGADSVERTRSDDLMDLLLVPVVAEFDPSLTVVRADLMPGFGSITDNIIHYLLNSAYVIADVTGFNRNVYYELGIAHAHHRKVVLITDTTKDLPFDTSSQAHIELPGEGPLGARAIENVKKKLLNTLITARDSKAAPGPVAAAIAQMTPPSISGDEAAEILRQNYADLTERVKALEVLAENSIDSVMGSNAGRAFASARAQVIHATPSGSLFRKLYGTQTLAIFESAANFGSWLLGTLREVIEDVVLLKNRMLQIRMRNGKVVQLGVSEDFGRLLDRITEQLDLSLEDARNLADLAEELYGRLS